MKDKKVILITALGSSNAQSIFKCLENYRNIFKIIGTDIYSPEEITYASKVDNFYTVPTATSSHYIDTLGKICNTESVNYVIPVYDLEVERLSEHKKEFLKTGAVICTPEFEVVKVCNDKLLFYEFCSRNNFDAIPTAESKKWDFPLFIKPNRGNGSQDCFVVFNQSELDVFIKRIVNPIIQPIHSGEKYVVDFFADENGKLIDAVARIELAAKAGNGTKVIIDQNESVLQITKDLVAQLNYQGLGNLEFFKKDNRFTIIELNPRVSSGIVFTHMAGSNLIAKMLNSLGENLPIEKQPILNKQRFHRTWQEHYIPTKK